MSVRSKMSRGAVVRRVGRLAWAPVGWLVRAVRAPGREREGLLQSVKIAVAAVAAWALARWLLPSVAFLAPYSALFLMNSTVSRSVADAVRQLLTLGLGVLLAFVAATLLGKQLAGLGMVAFLGTLLGNWPRLGRNGVWVGVTALFALLFGQAADPLYLG